MNTARILTIVTLILLLSVFCLETVSANITIDGNTIHVETNNYKVQLEYGAIIYLHNKLTDETYTLPLEPIFETYPAILGTNKNFRSPRARTVKTHKINDNTVESIFQRDGNQIKLVIAIDPHTDDLLISGDCIADTPGVYAIQQWGIDNLNPNLTLLAPSEKIQLIDANFTRDYRGFVYPSTSWEAQLAIIEAQNGGFYVQSTDTALRFKTMVYENHTDKFSLRFRTENQAPWDNLTTATSVTWKFNTYAGDWCVPAQMYRDWMEQAFDPWRLSDMPPWVKDIGLVVIHSALNPELLPSLAEMVDPTKTLLYLTDWRKDRHPINYPDYTPHENFDEFLKVAHHHGFRVMLHASLYDLSPFHPLYIEFKRFQYQDPWTGELTGWKWNEIDNPERNAHINPASSKWRNLTVQRLKAVWEKYKIDAFHLDVSSHILNDANGLIEGLTSAEGNVLMHKELAQAMPGVVLGGEGLHEVTFFRESFAQRRGKIIGDSHPLTGFLFSPYTRFYGGLDTPAGADSHDYQLFLKNAQTQGYIPTHWINKTEMLEIPLIQQVLSVARRSQELGLQPDITCDWGPDTLFQYTTHTGETVTYQRTDSGSALVLPNTDGFEQVYGVTQAQTHRSLRYWHAYNRTTLLGLDPNKFYFLDNTPPDFSQLHINSLSPDIYITETRVTDQAALFQLESTSSNKHTNIGFYLPTTPIGSFPDTLRPTGSGQYTLEADVSKPVVVFFGPVQQVNLPYDLIEAKAQYTAGFQLHDIFELGSIHGSGDHARANIDNIGKETINAIPPAGGQTVIQFSLSLPQEPSTFFFSAGLYEGCSKGVVFEVRLNGQTYFETFKDTFDWTDGSISLSQFAGQSLLLELVTDSNGSNSCDWAHWADLRITADPNPDANLDGEINVLDLILVAQHFNEQPPGNPQADTNKDGIVNLFDLVFVVEHLSQNAAAPAQLRFIEAIPSSAKEVIAAQRALTELQAIPNRTPRIQIAIELLRHYLAVADRNVKETKLLPNYPNPFNPDTWIPYQLSEAATVTLKIYDVTGSRIRTIQVGHKSIGYYLTRERAIYWDGRNQKGEQISSGVYFYTLNTDTHTQTRRMVILK